MKKSEVSSINNSSEIQSPQCQFFVLRKKRLCRMTVRPGRQYCGEHEPQPKVEDGQVDTRIQCPNDPKHTCYASKLEKHLSICNARLGELPPYIVKGINAGPGSDEGPRPLLSEVPRDVMERLIDKVNKLYDKYIKDNIAVVAEEPIHPIVLADYEQSDRTESSRRHLQQASSLLRLAERGGLVADRTCYVELGAGKGHMSYYAWRAWCEPTSRASSVLLVDRASLRHKRDNKLRDLAYTTARHKAQESLNEDRASPAQNSQNQTNTTLKETLNVLADDHIPDTEATVKSTNETSQALNHSSDITKNMNSKDFTPTDINADFFNMEAPVRLRADLADLALENVPVVQECDRVVGFAKHLCGIATDFALRCITSDALGSKAQGVVIATCCHHRCRTSAYVGMRHLNELGVTEEDMRVLYGAVSWATCGDGRSRARRTRPAAAHHEEPPHAAQAQAQTPAQQDREALGRRAKALLDWGRVLHLRAAGYCAALRRYVPAAASPENLAIVATKIRG